MLNGIDQILDRLRIPYFREGGHHHCRPGWLQLDCPFCGPGSGKCHLGYNLQSGYWHCWKCGGLYRVKVLEALGASRDEIQGIKLEPWKTSTPKARGGLKEPKGRGPLAKAHKHYLQTRGLDPDTIERVWKVEGIGLAARLAWRIYIPIHLYGERVSWTSRTIGNSPQRYISASAEEESINHKELVYGLEHCSYSIVIVEGPADAWRVGPGAGALFGSSFSSAQVLALSRIPYRYVCFDAGAQGKAKKLANQLSAFPGATEVVELEADDPGSASWKEIKLLRKVAKLA